VVATRCFAMELTLTLDETLTLAVEQLALALA
jgi:hypothetical protein